MSNDTGPSVNSTLLFWLITIAGLLASIATVVDFIIDKWNIQDEHSQTRPGDHVEVSCPLIQTETGLRSKQINSDTLRPFVYYAVMEDIRGVCRYEGDDLLADIRLDLVVELDRDIPAVGATVKLSYFVAVSRLNGDLVDRQNYVSRITFSPGARKAGSTETFVQRFIGLAHTAKNYRVLFGFEPPGDSILPELPPQNGGL